MVCGDPCGWTAAVIAAVSYGSYGVPIKAAMDVHDVHPLVFQSYKTLVLFVLSWWFVLRGEEEAKWTPYGILSGFLWVAGGSCGILAIRRAGMAAAVGTWASVMVLMNFVWGILVFREPVRSLPRTCLAFGTLSCGLVGMSKYSASAAVPKEGLASKAPNNQRTSTDEEERETLVQTRCSMDKESLTSRQWRVDEKDVVAPMLELSTKHSPLVDEQDEKIQEEDERKIIHSVLVGIPLTQRESGILFAVLNGLLAGSSLIPMHFAKAQGFLGRSYILSFGSGSMVANLIIWLGYFFYMYINNNNSKNNNGRSEGRTPMWMTCDLMPSFHWKALWFRGFMAGLLLTVGMFGAIFAITFLGQGVGNSLVQSKILISGLWGILYFKEVKDPTAIGKWFASATVCVASILWLSYERTMATSGGD